MSLSSSPSLPLAPDDPGPYVDSVVRDGLPFQDYDESEEDLERRWVAVGIYGGIILFGVLLAYLAYLSAAGQPLFVAEYGVGDAMFLTGLMALIVGLLVLFVFVSGEAAFAGGAAGLTVGLAGALVFIRYDGDPGDTLLVLGVIAIG